MNIKFSFILFLLFCIVNQSFGSNKSDSLRTNQIDSSLISIYKYSESALTKTYFETAGEKLETPFSIIVKSGDTTLSNWPVNFSLISSPSKSNGTKLIDTLVYTNENGIASTYAILGTQEGIYEFSARIINTSGQNDIVYFKASARKSNWLFYLFSGIFGGLAIFLFGMELMSKALRKAAGNKMRSILSSLTNNKVIAVGIGALVTMVIQSSSATTVLLVSFVQAQLMTFTQSLGIILGSGIGTTITAQLIAFKLTDYALIVIGLGFLVLFFSKNKKVKNIGNSILGFGLLFYGMWIMSSAMYPLRTYEPFLHLLQQLESPLLGIIVGTIFTALIQSSSAFTGIILVLGSQGLITLEAAIPLIFGANIGTCITALLAGLNTGREAKRVAIAHTIFKIAGVLLFLFWIPTFAELVRMISPTGDTSLTDKAYLADVIPRQVANAHTIFNVVITFLILPFTTLIGNLILMLLPDKVDDEKEGKFQTQFLEESLVSTPVLALNLSKAEIIQMAKKVQSLVEKVTDLFFNYNDDLVDQIKEQEAEINYLNIHISKYLMKVSQEDLAEERTNEIFQMIHCVTELEQMGDIVAKRLLPLAKKKNRMNTDFSDKGKEEIKDFHLRTLKQISRAINVFTDVNLKDAKRMEKKYRKYKLMELDSRRTHFDRLREDVPETVATSQVHLQLMELLKRISSHATNMARIFLEVNTDQDEELLLRARLAKIEKSKKYREGESSIEEEEKS